jgi:hypothetical protein
VNASASKPKKCIPVSTMRFPCILVYSTLVSWQSTGVIGHPLKVKVKK